MGQAQEQAEKLVAAVREIVSLFEVGYQQLDMARAQAEQMNQLACDATEGGFALPQLSLEDRSADIHESLRRGVRRETALCDAYDSLISLACVPVLVEHVLQVSAALREYRLLQVTLREDDLNDLGPAQMPSPPRLGVPIDAREHKRWLMEMSRRVAQWSRERMDRSRIRHDHAMAESDRLLRRALEAAEQLSAAARAM